MGWFKWKFDSSFLHRNINTNIIVHLEPQNLKLLFAKDFVVFTPPGVRKNDLDSDFSLGA